jgi:O-antigen/teichoic acid export membrane protein
MRIDQIMIKEILGEEAVGKYSAAVRLSELWYFVPVIMVNSLFPSVVNAKNVSEKLYHTRLQRLFTTLVWMAIAFAAPMIFLSDSLITLLYGEAYKEAGQVLMIHAWAGIFVSLGAASGVWYISENLQQYAFYRTLLGAIINVALNFILIPIYGVIGAALATVAAQSMAALFFDALTKRTRMVFFMKLKTLYFSNLLQRE